MCETLPESVKLYPYQGTISDQVTIFSLDRGYCLILAIRLCMHGVFLVKLLRCRCLATAKVFSVVSQAQTLEFVSRIRYSRRYIRLTPIPYRTNQGTSKSANNNSRLSKQNHHQLRILSVHRRPVKYAKIVDTYLPISTEYTDVLLTLIFK